MRVLLLVNATASSVTNRKRRKIRKMLAEHHDVEVAETSRRGHATRLAHAAAHDGFDVVAVFGGDGTLNESAEGLLHSHTAIAPLPGGSTNVYARTLGYPNERARQRTWLLASLARLHEAHRCRRRQSPALLVQHRDRVRRRRRPARRALLTAQAVRAHPLHVVAAVSAYFHREAHARIEGSSSTAARQSRVRFASSRKPTRTHSSGDSAPCAPGAGSSALSLTAFRALVQER
jgi:hypothetical protein